MQISPAKPADSHVSTDDYGSVADASTRRWLRWLGDMLPKHQQLLFFKVNDDEIIAPLAVENRQRRPDESVLRAVTSAVDAKNSVYVTPDSRLPVEQQNAVFAVPIKTSNFSIDAVLVLVCTPMTKIQQRTVAKLVQWAAQRLQADLEPSWPNNTGIAPEARLSQALLSTLTKHGTLTSLAFSLANTLAELCGCVRVSVGRYAAGELSLLAMSGQSNLDHRRQLAQQLRGVMHSALDSGCLLYPDADGERETIACQVYFREQGEHPMLAFVFGATKEFQFVLVLERAKGEQFLPAQVDAIQSSVHPVAALLDQTSRVELAPFSRARSWIRTKKDRLLQVTNWTGKQLFGALAMFLLLMSMVLPTTHRVSANAYIEASDRQVLVAPQAGFIKSANARAGDYVSKGDVLATLEGDELRLEADKWRSEQNKNQHAYAQALAIHDRTELSRLRADRKRIDAELALIEQRLVRSELRAPFSGVLMAGDWTQALGSPVEAGDILFEIASAEKYQLVIEVDEHDIAHIQPAQTADLRMTALPTTVWRAKLGDVLPVAVSVQGKSSFRVLAEIDGDANALRPGMQGVGKVHIGNRSLFWVYSHRLADRLRYFSWKIGLT